jgi:hypothetical protein
MKIKSCRLCGKLSGIPIFSARVLGQSVSYFDCVNCGYVQTEEPTWLSNAYQDSINRSDTGILARNLSNVSLVLATLTLIQAKQGRVIDYAGGYGFLVRLLRDKGVDAFWSDRYSDNLVARGFEYSGQKMGGEGADAALVTAFEAFEHFVDPIAELQRLVSISPNILLTTNLIASPAPDPSEWWYYGCNHGQHIGFYRLRSLRYLADNFGLHLITDGAATHLLSRTRYNRAIWKLLLKVGRKYPELLKFGLDSKTHSDNLLLVGLNNKEENQ